ncbi:peptidase [Naematelia encephala]|uniref:Peptide hydrolase n=1 Tax=Naematelia encephala TaxID=71784 RepID=A0A1Y2AIC6_9TREE|nr:peptidase [Naematelia encephala]
MMYTLAVLLWSLLATTSAHQVHQHASTATLNHPESTILEALSTYNDPVQAMVALHPSSADMLAEPRLLEVMDGSEVRWMTEGDKLRLRREDIDFIDWTRRDLLVERGFQADPNMPKVSHQAQVRKVFPHLSTTNMFEFLETFTAYYNRLYTSKTGVESQRWLYDEILDIIRKAPSTCRLSVEQIPHLFPQNSIIARFSPSGPRNISQTVTIIGSHLDSVNQYFPLLNAPGADDDGSGTATILEAFRSLVQVGYSPVDGPVEFHWWAGEEAGLLGSMDVAEDYKARGLNVGAVLNVDETAFIKVNSTPAINLIEVGATEKLNKWVHDLAKEYVDIGVKYSGMVGRGLDHQAWTRHGYSAVSIVEGDQAEGGWLPFPHTGASFTARNSKS